MLPTAEITAEEFVEIYDQTVCVDFFSLFFRHLRLKIGGN